jgi:predicted amidohydrolase YtcJ
MSRPEAIETRMTQWIAEHKPAAGEWIVAAGFNPKLAVVRGFDKTFADRIAADNPLLLLSLDHRVAVMNSKAIDLCRPEAEPNGLVREGAVFLLMNRVWSLQPDAVRRDATERFGQAASRFGITTVGSPMMVPADLQTAEAMIAEGRMPVRLVAGALGANAPARTAFAEYNDARKSPDPERLSIGPTMYQLDGSLLGWGAALFQVYKDSIWTSGLLAMPPDEINRLVRASAVGDAGLVVDATGDLAVHLLFDALEKEPSMRVRADGLDVMTPADRARLPRIARTGLIASLQPTQFPFRLFLQSSIGEDQMASAMPYRALVDAGVPVTINSDWPITAQTFKPMQVMEWAVTRAGWRPEEGLTIAQALRAYTLDAARALGAQDRVGSIEVGKKADLVVLDRNPIDLTATPEQLSEIAVRLTVSGGTIEFEDRPVARAAPASSGAGKSRR